MSSIKQATLQIENKCAWIAVALLFKSLYFIFFARQFSSYEGGIWGVYAVDTSGYIVPFEDLFTNGQFSEILGLPGYGVLYLILRFFFNQIISLNAITVIQLIFSSLSVYYIAYTSYLIFNSRVLFYISYIIYLISTYVSVFDIYLLTESFATSSLIFALYFYTKYFLDGKRFSLLLSGLLITWGIILRAVFLPLLALFVFYLFINGINRPPRSIHVKSFAPILLYILPFILFETFWLSYNFNRYHQFVPLQKHFYSLHLTRDELSISLVEFLKSWGGDFVYWNPSAEIVWFQYLESVTYKIGKELIEKISFPKYIYTSKFDYDDLVQLRLRILSATSSGGSLTYKKLQYNLCAMKLREYTSSIKREKPIVYYVYAPLRLFWKFLFHSGTYNLLNKPFKELNHFALIFKIVMSSLYIFIVLGGLFGGILLVCRNLQGFKLRLVLALIPFYFIFAHAFVLRCIEYRYFVPAYPFMVVLSSYVCWFSFDFIRRSYRTIICCSIFRQGVP